VSNTVIENFEPLDDGWGFVIAQFMNSPLEDEHETVVDSDDEQNPSD
jgi:hypothetical protein